MLQLLKKKAEIFSNSPTGELKYFEGPGIGSFIQNVGRLNILYFAIQDFPTLSAMYGPEWGDQLENEIRMAIINEGTSNLSHDDFHIFLSMPVNFFC